MSARILYFGSRTWLDVPPGMSYDDTRYAIRRRGEVPPAWRGPKFATLLDVMRGDIARHGRIVVIEGEADGWDILSRIVAKELGQEVDPYPVDTAIDGPWPAAGPKRNARMVRDGRPYGARVGVPVAPLPRIGKHGADPSAAVDPDNHLPRRRNCNCVRPGGECVDN